MSEIIKLHHSKTITPSIKVNRKDYKIEGATPIVSQEIDYISGYCDLSDSRIPHGKYICFGDHSEHIKYIDFAFVQGADGLKVLTFNENFLLTKYTYYCLSNFYKRQNSYQRHFKNLLETTIPIPSLEEQQRIVDILDRFETLTTDLQSGLPAEIAARRRQYEYYREQLLTLKRKSA